MERLIYQCTNGVPIGYEGPRCFRLHDNWPSSVKHYDAVQSSINKDVRLGVKVGPFDQPPFINFVGSPMGAYQKRHSSKYRVIHDLSWPPGGSINDFINVDNYHVTYLSLDDVVSQIEILGPSCLLAKLDLEDAFKHIPVRPEDWELLGSTWYIYDQSTNSYDLKYFYDRVLQFGCRSSPKLFNDFADGAQYVMQYAGVSYVDHYLDDYITAGKAGSNECANNLQVMCDVCEDLGFSLNPSKVVPPTTVLEFLGIILDTDRMEMRISEERLADILHELHHWENRHKCTKRELLSIIGKLLFVARVVRPGRTFVRRMIDLSKRIKHLHHKIRLNKEFRADVEWWLNYLPAWNGVPMLSAPSVDIHVFTDASNIAFSGFYDDHWFVATYAGSLEQYGQRSINWRELQAVVTAAATWGASWHNKRVLFHCDNSCVVHILNSGSSKSPVMMQLVRTLFFISATHEFEFTSVYVNTHDNTVADALSRLRFDIFYKQLPNADFTMTQPVVV